MGVPWMVLDIKALNLSFQKEKLGSSGSHRCYNEMVLFEDLLYKLKLIELINEQNGQVFV